MEKQHSARLLGADLLDKLRIEILSAQLRPGEKLTEISVCENYGVSRTPVREALGHLEAEGLIEMIPNRGAFVIGLTKDDIHDLYTLRSQNEMQAVRWAVERRTKEEMEAIEESFDFMRYYTKRGDSDRMRTINAGFHRRISAASHNRLLIDSLLRIQNYLLYSSFVLPCREADLDVIFSEHKEVFSSFKADDPEAGAMAMKKHIENSHFRAIV